MSSHGHNYCCNHMVDILLNDLHVLVTKVPILNCDNLSALHLTVNSMFHARTKDIKIDYHYIREQIALHKLETKQVPSSNPHADIFTKVLLSQKLPANLLKLGIFPVFTLGKVIRE